MNPETLKNSIVYFLSDCDLRLGWLRRNLSRSCFNFSISKPAPLEKHKTFFNCCNDSWSKIQNAILEKTCWLHQRELFFVNSGYWSKFHQLAKPFEGDAPTADEAERDTSQKKSVKKRKSEPNPFKLEMSSSPQPINNFQEEIKLYLDQETVVKDVDVLN